MPKWDKSRNYYADLDVHPTASTDEIKKQFKKLALKYHPDRNPGREAEVNPKFQIIQSAHEILIDDVLRRQYDDARRSHTARYPMASGVRGNPWQDIAKQYPPPPRRPQPPPRPSAAQRYANFANGMPRPTRPTPADDPQSRKSNADAWESMRSHANRAKAPPTPGRAPTSAAREAKPGPVPPRTAYQKEKAQAAFGSRRTGFTPHSPGVADEPPVTNKNYFTTRTHSNIFAETKPETTPDNHQPSTPVDPFVDIQERYMDGRKSTPYHSSGGEKTSLFADGPGLSRTTSARAPPRKMEMPGAFPRSRPRRSSSPKSSSNDGGSEDSSKVNAGLGASANRRASYSSSHVNMRATGDRSDPMADPTNTAPQPNTASQPKPAAAGHAPTEPANFNTAPAPGTGSAHVNSGPSVYASQPTKHSHLSNTLPQFYSVRSQPDRAKEHAPRALDWLSIVTGFDLRGPSSEGMKQDSPTLTPLEAQQRRTLSRLMETQPMLGKDLDRLATEAKNKAKDDSSASATKQVKTGADKSRSSSFNFSAANDSTSKDASTKPFTSSSADNINTKFVQDDHPDDWQFKAGASSASEAYTPSKPRLQPRTRVTRRQVQKSRPAPTIHMTSAPESSEDTSKQGFSAGEWNEQIGSHHFEPQPSNSASSSPARRMHSKKSKPVKMTAGTAGMVDEEESEGWQEIPRPPSDTTSASVSASGAPPSPNAMDIDSPAPGNVEDTPKASQTNGARNIPVEPHRADWRAGKVDGVHSSSASSTSDADSTKSGFLEPSVPQPMAAPAVANPFIPHNGGSEDTEEFRMKFTEFKKVEPFVDSTPTGLKSFSDLKSTLPFESRPSEQIPLEKVISPAPLVFPTPPVAPRLPPPIAVAGLRPNATSFRKYAQDFYNYMDKWESFHNKIMLHFSTRQDNFKTRRQQRGAAWLDISLGSDGAREYLAELDQDQAIHSQWLDAIREHRKKVAEFTEFRDRVK
ncbi:hypothetical protein F5X99DRAFT_277229 [Biscogniauxia marginata]|nr:hypothetical protein F5X99DRAFT_277229 [Biscogniauxia marginata]